MVSQRQRIAILTEAVNIMGEYVHMAKALQDNRIAIELCGSRLSAPVGVWRSARYPEPHGAPGLCNVTVAPFRDAEFIRLDFVDVTLGAPRDEVCGEGGLTIYDQTGGSGGAICGALTNYSTVVRVLPSPLGWPVGEVRLVMNILNAHSKYDIKITQILRSQLSLSQGGLPDIGSFQQSPNLELDLSNDHSGPAALVQNATHAVEAAGSYNTQVWNLSNAPDEIRIFRASPVMTMDEQGNKLFSSSFLNLGIPVQSASRIGGQEDDLPQSLPEEQEYLMKKPFGEEFNENESIKLKNESSTNSGHEPHDEEVLPMNNFHDKRKSPSIGEAKAKQIVRDSSGNQLFASNYFSLSPADTSAIRSTATDQHGAENFETQATFPSRESIEYFPDDNRTSALVEALEDFSKDQGTSMLLNGSEDSKENQVAINSTDASDDFTKDQTIFVLVKLPTHITEYQNTTSYTVAFDNRLPHSTIDPPNDEISYLKVPLSSASEMMPIETDTKNYTDEDHMNHDIFSPTNIKSEFQLVYHDNTEADDAVALSGETKPSMSLERKHSLQYFTLDRVALAHPPYNPDGTELSHPLNNHNGTELVESPYNPHRVEPVHQPYNPDGAETVDQPYNPYRVELIDPPYHPDGTEIVYTQNLRQAAAVGSQQGISSQTQAALNALARMKIVQMLRTLHEEKAKNINTDGNEAIDDTQVMGDKEDVDIDNQASNVSDEGADESNPALYVTKIGNKLYFLRRKSESHQEPKSPTNVKSATGSKDLSLDEKRRKIYAQLAERIIHEEKQVIPPNRNMESSTLLRLNTGSALSDLAARNQMQENKKIELLDKLKMLFERSHDSSIMQHHNIGTQKPRASSGRSLGERKNDKFMEYFLQHLREAFLESLLTSSLVPETSASGASLWSMSENIMTKQALPTRNRSLHVRRPGASALLGLTRLNELMLHNSDAMHQPSMPHPSDGLNDSFQSTADASTVEPLNSVNNVSTDEVTADEVPPDEVSPDEVSADEIFANEVSAVEIPAVDDELGMDVRKEPDSSNIQVPQNTPDVSHSINQLVDAIILQWVESELDSINLDAQQTHTNSNSSTASEVNRDLRNMTQSLTDLSAAHLLKSLILSQNEINPEDNSDLKMNTFLYRTTTTPGTSPEEEAMSPSGPNPLGALPEQATAPPKNLEVLKVLQENLQNAINEHILRTMLQEQLQNILVERQTQPNDSTNIKQPALMTDERNDSLIGALQDDSPSFIIADNDTDYSFLYDALSVQEESTKGYQTVDFDFPRPEIANKTSSLKGTALTDDYDFPDYHPSQVLPDVYQYSDFPQSSLADPRPPSLENDQNSNKNRIPSNALAVLLQFAGLKQSLALNTTESASETSSISLDKTRLSDVAPANSKVVLQLIVTGQSQVIPSGLDDSELVDPPRSSFLLVNFPHHRVVNITTAEQIDRNITIISGKFNDSLMSPSSNGDDLSPPFTISVAPQFESSAHIYKVGIIDNSALLVHRSDNGTGDPPVGGTGESTFSALNGSANDNLAQNDVEQEGGVPVTDSPHRAPSARFPTLNMGVINYSMDNSLNDLSPAATTSIRPDFDLNSLSGNGSSDHSNDESSRINGEYHGSNDENHGIDGAATAEMSEREVTPINLTHTMNEDESTVGDVDAGGTVGDKDVDGGTVGGIDSVVMDVVSMGNASSEIRVTGDFSYLDTGISSVSNTGETPVMGMRGGEPLPGGVPAINTVGGEPLPGGAPTIQAVGGEPLPGGAPTIQAVGGEPLPGGAPTIQTVGGEPLPGGVPAIHTVGGEPLPGGAPAIQAVGGEPLPGGALTIQAAGGEPLPGGALTIQAAGGEPLPGGAPTIQTVGGVTRIAGSSVSATADGAPKFVLSKFIPGISLSGGLSLGLFDGLFAANLNFHTINEVTTGNPSSIRNDDLSEQTLNLENEIQEESGTFSISSSDPSLRNFSAVETMTNDTISGSFLDGTNSILFDAGQNVSTVGSDIQSFDLFNIVQQLTSIANVTFSPETFLPTAGSQALINLNSGSQISANRSSVSETSAKLNSGSGAPANQNSVSEVPANQNSDSAAPANQNSSVSETSAKLNSGSGAPANQNSVSEATENQNSIFEALANQNSDSKAPSNQNSVFDAPANQNSVSEAPANQNSYSAAPANQNSVSEATENQNSVFEAPTNQNSVSEAPENRNSVSKAPENQNSVSEAPENQNSGFEASANHHSGSQASANQTSGSSGAPSSNVPTLPRNIPPPRVTATVPPPPPHGASYSGSLLTLTYAGLRTCGATLLSPTHSLTAASCA
ncbi:uncharacterized protein LOC108664642, partial [Hyalella azteca]|uniref:Uncharacterized protein LOC108664642 n=1 Tax=Hyalella azteca TaxID=294128 RepID=A0A979FGY1_HYAAZ